MPDIYFVAFSLIAFLSFTTPNQSICIRSQWKCYFHIHMSTDTFSLALPFVDVLIRRGFLLSLLLEEQEDRRKKTCLWRHQFAEAASSDKYFAQESKGSIKLYQTKQIFTVPFSAIFHLSMLNKKWKRQYFFAARFGMVKNCLFAFCHTANEYIRRHTWEIIVLENVCENSVSKRQQQK